MSAAETWVDAPEWHVRSAAPETPEVVRVGDTLAGRYRLTARLGVGNFGSVYSATDALYPERHVALKILSGRSRGSGTLEMARAEFLAIAEIAHPNLSRAYDFDRCDAPDIAFFTMEHVDGVPLRYAPERPFDAAVEAIVQVLRALSTIHAHGLVHRDLKPDNILIDVEGRVRLVDFGLVGARGANLVVGSPGYMAPEAFLGVEAADHRSDLYSVGLIALEVCCGRASPSDLNLRLYAERHANTLRDIAGLVAVPDGFTQWIATLCSPLASDRYQTADAAIVALNRLCDFHFAGETAATVTGHVMSARLVGRQAELSSAWEFIRRSVAGGWFGPERACWIRGESNVGKRRFTRELELRAQLEGIRFVRAATGAGATDEWAQVRAVLQQLIAGQTTDNATDAVRDAIQLLESLQAPRAGTPPPLTPRAVADIAAEVLFRLGLESPYVLLLADFDHARQGVLYLVEGLLHRLRGVTNRPALVMLATIEEPSGDEQFPHPLLALPREDIRQVWLWPLALAEVAELMASMLGGKALPDGLVRAAFRESQGAPGLIEALMESLVADHGLFQPDGTWLLPDDPDECLARIRTAHGRRLHKLTPAELQALACVAAANQPLDINTLALALGCDVASLGQTALALIRARLIRRVAGKEARFAVTARHISELALAALGPTDRAQLHAQLADAYETTAPDDLQARGYHLREAGQTARAAECLLVAAGRVRAAAGAETAMALYAEARLLLRPDQQREHATVAEAVADLQVLLGNYIAARDGYLALYPDAAQEQREVLDIKLGHVHLQAGEYDLAIGQLQLPLLGRWRNRELPRGPAALLIELAKYLWTRKFPRQLAPPAERPARQNAAAAHFRLAQVYLFVSPKDMVVNLLRAVSHGEHAGPSAELANAYGLLGVAACTLNRRDAALRLVLRASDVAARCGNDDVLPRLRSYRALVHLCRLECAAAEAGFTLAERELLLQGDPWELSAAISGLASTYHVMGRPNLAVQSALRGVERMERMGTLAFGRILVSQSAMLLAEVGRHTEVDAMIAQGQALMPEGDDLLSVATHDLGAGIAVGLRGDLAAACHRLARACDALSTAGHAVDMVSEAFAMLPLFYLEHTWFGGDVATGVQQAALARAAVWTQRKPMFRALYLAARAGYEARVGKQAAAQKSLTQAQWHARRDGLMVMEADAALTVGREWLRHAETAELGRQLLQTALRSYTRHGATARAARVEAVLGG